MTLETRIKRLRFRSWHRGCKETDLVLGPFSERALPTLTNQDIDLYELFLDEDDADIWRWITGKDVPEKYRALVARLQPLTDAATGPNAANDNVSNG